MRLSIPRIAHDNGDYVHKRYVQEVVEHRHLPDDQGGSQPAWNGGVKRTKKKHRGSQGHQQI